MLTSSPTLKKEIPTKVGWYKLTPSHRFLIHRQCQRILSTDLISHQSNGTTRSIDKTSNVGNKKISPYIPYLKRRGFTASWIKRLGIGLMGILCVFSGEAWTQQKEKKTIGGLQGVLMTDIVSPKRCVGCINDSPLLENMDTGEVAMIAIRGGVGMPHTFKNSSCQVFVTAEIRAGSKGNAGLYVYPTRLECLKRGAILHADIAQGRGYVVDSHQNCVGQPSRKALREKKIKIIGGLQDVVGREVGEFDSFETLKGGLKVKLCDLSFVNIKEVTHE